MGITQLNLGGPCIILSLVMYIIFTHCKALSPDGEALLSFRTSIISSDSILLQWRPEDPDPCMWKGVTCNPKSKKVIYLRLPNHKLSGSIPPDLGKLDQLEILALHNNNFYGNIPSELGNCTSLRALICSVLKLQSSLQSASLSFPLQHALFSSSWRKD